MDMNKINKLSNNAFIVAFYIFILERRRTLQQIRLSFETHLMFLSSHIQKKLQDSFLNKENL
jgi:hypothetical protein